MGFWVTFSINILMAIIIVFIYSGMFYLVIRHYSSSHEVIEQEDFLLTENIRFNKAGDIILKIVCVAMVLFIFGSLGIFLYQLLKYYFAVIPANF